MSVLMFSKFNMSKGWHISTSFVKGSLYTEQNEDYAAQQQKSPTEAVFFHMACS